jgi:hypothetical protein
MPDWLSSSTFRQGGSIHFPPAHLSQLQVRMDGWFFANNRCIAPARTAYVVSQRMYAYIL